jgi:plasmid maintenance system antidote protein VapI
MTLTEYLRARFEARGKSVEEIAKELGIQYQRYVEMLITGEAKLPLDRVLPMSRVIDGDPRLMFRLGMRQYTNMSDAELDELLGKL